MLSRLGVRLPIVQAPMAGVSNPTLAAAVTNAGGLGSIGVGASTPAAARQAIEELRTMTTGSFNVNVFVHPKPKEDPARAEAWLKHLLKAFKEFDVAAPTSLKEIYTTFAEDKEMLQVLLDTRPAVVSFHFGLPPSDAITQLKSAGILLWCAVTSLDEGKQAQNAGVDCLVAQGIEAGGHRGMFDPYAVDHKLTTFALTRILVQQTDLPVIAAGGIMDGQGIKAALNLGAIAAQLGTAFVTTTESSADRAYREAFNTSSAHQTVLTSAISGRPARCLSNMFTEYPVDKVDIPQYPYTYDAGKALHAAGKAKGISGFGAQWAGQGAPLARHIPAAELMAALEQEMR